MRSGRPRALRGSSVRAGAAMRAQLHGAVGNGQPQRRADRAFDEADFAAVGADKFGGDGEAETGAAGPGRTLERLEEMRLRPFGKAGAGVGDLDDDDRAFAPSGDADLIAAGVA